MPNKLADELRALDDRELQQRLIEAQNNLVGTRFALATHQSENTAGLKKARQQIARIKEILHERERGL